MILFSNPPAAKRAQPWLGTLVSLQLSGLPSRDADAAMEAAFAEVQKVHRLMSFHDPGSDVSRLNALRGADVLQVHPYTYEVMRRAMEVSAASDGCFDIAVGTELVTWGHLPVSGERQSPKVARWHDIELLADERIRVHRPLCLDLGGIAKGFAVDRATEVLTAWGAKRSVVNAGGDLRVCGEGPEWIALAADGSPAGRPVLALEDGSVASSGGTKAAKASDTPGQGPHVDGRSRLPADPHRFVSVLACECIVADALTKVVMAQGVEARPVLERFKAQAYLHDPESGWQSICCAEELAVPR